jgi:mannose-6-phosphate isomerase
LCQAPVLVFGGWHNHRYNVPRFAMSSLNLTAPLTFEPLFMERIWGGRRLETEFGKKLPPHGKIGEAWEITDREEAQSVVRGGPLHGKTLHALWIEYRVEIFGDVPAGSRFPLLVKLLHAQEKLSLQVHPPEKVAKELGGEPKTEFWYVAAAEPNAEIFVGLRHVMARSQFKEALDQGTIAEHVHVIRVRRGDAMFLQAGRFHAVGAGNLLVEIQQNSDTTYRVFDWNRLDQRGEARALHVEQALASIDFNDVEPALIKPQGELLVRDALFEIQKWDLRFPRELVPSGQFAIACCLSGKLHCGRIDFSPGEFFLLPAHLPDRNVVPIQPDTSLLRVTIPV